MQTEVLLIDLHAVATPPRLVGEQIDAGVGQLLPQFFTPGNLELNEDMLLAWSKRRVVRCYASAGQTDVVLVVLQDDSGLDLLNQRQQFVSQLQGGRGTFASQYVRSRGSSMSSSSSTPRVLRSRTVVNTSVIALSTSIALTWMAMMGMKPLNRL